MRRLPSMLVLAGLVVSVIEGCHMPHLLYGKRIAGQVVDADTGQPIVAAHVAFLWRTDIIPSGFTGHNSRVICFHAAATTTDAQGRFEIPPWWKWKTYNVYNVDPTVLVYAGAYKPIQRSVHQEGTSAPAEHLAERYSLTKFAGDSKSRLDMLFFGLANQGCDYGGDSQRSLYPMLKAIHEEARRIGTRQEAHGFAVLAAYAALALDPNGPGEDDKMNAFIRENLQ